MIRGNDSAADFTLPFQHRTQYVQTALHGIYALDDHAATTIVLAQDAGTEILGGILNDAVEGCTAIEGAVGVPNEV